MTDPANGNGHGRHYRWAIGGLCTLLMAVGAGWVSAIQTKVDAVEAVQSSRGERITKLEAEMANLKAEIPRLTGDIAALRNDIAILSRQLERLSGTLGRRGFIGGRDP